MKRDIFISYSRKDLEAVLAIKEVILNSISTECWMDLEGIESGAIQFTQNIIAGIEECNVFLFMLSEKSQESDFALRELNYASKKAQKNIHKHVVIVNIDNCKMSDEFEFIYGLTDMILWSNLPQRKKLIRDLKKWIGNDNSSIEIKKDCDNDSASSVGIQDMSVSSEREAKDREHRRRLYKKIMEWTSLIKSLLRSLMLSLHKIDLRKIKVKKIRNYALFSLSAIALGIIVCFSVIYCTNQDKSYVKMGSEEMIGLDTLLEQDNTVRENDNDRKNYLLSLSDSVFHPFSDDLTGLFGSILS